MTRLPLLLRLLVAAAIAVGAYTIADIASPSTADAQSCNNGGVTGTTGGGHTGVPGCNTPGQSGPGTPGSGGGNKPAGSTWCIQLRGPAYWGWTYTRDGSDCAPRPGYNDPGTCVVGQNIRRDGFIVATRGADWPWGHPNCLDTWTVDLRDYVACGTWAYMSTSLAYASTFPNETHSTPVLMYRGWDEDSCSQPRSSRTDFPGGEVWGPLPTAIEANIVVPEAAHVGGRLRPNVITAATGRLMCGSVPCPTTGPQAPRLGDIAYGLELTASETYRRCDLEGQRGCDYFLRYVADDSADGGSVRAELLAYAATRPNERVNVSIDLRQGTATQFGTLSPGGYTECTWRVRTSNPSIEVPGSRRCTTVHNGPDTPISREVPLTVFGDTDGDFPVVSATNRVR